MSQIRCPECGNVCSSGDSFCPKCGREFKKTDSRKNVGSALPAMEPVQVPEGLSVDELVQKGFELISQDQYTEASAYWVQAVKDGYVPDDETYGRMVSETGACMLRISSTSNVIIRKGAADLSLVLDDRDFSADLLAEYARRVPECGGQVTVVNLSTNYVILMIECFNVYTDLRDLQQLCLNAQLFLKDAVAREEELKDDGSLDLDKAMKYIDTNIGLVNEIEKQITAAISKFSMEDLDRMSDYWSEQPSIPYLADLMVALQFSIQLRVTGKFSSKMFTKTRDGEIKNFLVKYVSALNR